MKLPSIRKNAALLSSSALTSQRDQLAAEVTAETALSQELEVLLPDLVGSPEFDVEVSRKSKIDLGLPAKVKALEFLEANIKDAKARENRERLGADIANFKASSERLAARLKREFPKLLQQSKALLEELQQNKDEHERLTLRARDAGVHNVGPDAEFIVRGIPAKETPAIYEDEEYLVDSTGREVAGGILGPDGLRIDHLQLRKMKRTVCRATARSEPAKLNGPRLAEAIRLIDIDGQKIWPAPPNVMRPR